ncbi:C1 family peptidase [Methanobrevibacter sp.]|uniref:C1 family peptidase n=1 Tax=Methanobrevibacter sp. TaxID=66852 RepID=UPI00388ED4C5
MNKLKIFLVFFVLFISISAVSAEGNFTSLQTDIANSENSIDITQDYIFDEKADAGLDSGIVIKKTNFVINGNGHTLDGNSMARIFNVAGESITINNLTFINGNANIGGAVLCDGNNAVINNCTFNKNNATTDGGAVIFRNNGKVMNSIFTDNYSPDCAAIGVYGSKVTVTDSTFNSKIELVKGFIHGATASIIIDTCTFEDTISKYAAVINDRYTEVRNSTFRNLEAKETGGALILKEVDKAIIYKSSFINVQSQKNAGAIFIDTPGYLYSDKGTTLINDSEFVNCSSNFGGAVVLLGGTSTITNCDFIDNEAEYDGGALYVSDNDLSIYNTQFRNNKLRNDVEYIHGGAIYADTSNMLIRSTDFIDNQKQAIYSYSCKMNIWANFTNNTEGVHGVFLVSYEVTFNTNTTDKFIYNDTDYGTYITDKGAELKLTNDTFIITKLPSRFDLNEWGFVTPIKNQGEDSSCWAFGTVGALESALLKATGIEYDFSENNLQNSLLRYSKYGNRITREGGNNNMAVLYALNWFGMVPTENDTYDEYGKIPTFTTPGNIHVQDVVIIPKRANLTDNNVVKRALIDYGGLSAEMKAFGKAPYYNTKTSAQYYNDESDVKVNHIVTLVGWDDNYSKNNFLITPPGDGAWIIKNSYGPDFGDGGFNYVSYYDVSLLSHEIVGYIFENDEPYDGNYQYDLGGEIAFYNKGQLNIMKNTYSALEDTYISAFGSWFEKDKPFTYEIYVNDKLRLSGSGKSSFEGYHTVLLPEYISIDKGDEFHIILNNTQLPMLIDTRQYFEEGNSLVYQENEWKDAAINRGAVSLKVYTQKSVPELKTEDLVKYYKNGTQFTADAGESGKEVIFEINSNNYTRTTNSEGIATININLNPGNYTIKTYMGKKSETKSSDDDEIIIQNDIEVLPTLIGDDLVKYYRNDSQFYISLVDGEGNPLSGESILMNINGVFYERTTNENGTAKLNINLLPGDYILTAIDPLTDLLISYNITVLPMLTAADLNMTYKDGSKFSATLVDGQGNPLSSVNITFNINGVFYNRTTDENGTARLNINLMPGEYIITSQYGTAMISNKITIIAKEE